MTAGRVELALGTVQFGLAYGVAGRSEAVPEAEVRDILTKAWDAGIRVLDTAAVYGDIESRLRGLTAGLGFHVVSKLPPLPAALAPEQVADWAQAALAQAGQRLGDLLRCVLFHRADDLLEAQGDSLWSTCTDFSKQRDVTLGVSCYDPATLDAVAQRFPVAVAQLPGNALDQRIAVPRAQAAGAVSIHLRSCFLQGLLLMPFDAAVARVPAARAPLERWHRWCAEHQLAPLRGALSIVKGLPGVSHCVVGVDSASQLDDIASHWDAARPIAAPQLQEHDLQVIDPRQWKASV